VPKVLHRGIWENGGPFDAEHQRKRKSTSGHDVYSHEVPRSHLGSASLMTAKRDKPPPPIVRKAGGRLSAVSAWDAELLDDFPDGMEFDLIARNKRTNPLHATYWKALTLAVEATGRWQSREALHTALKVQQGLVEPLYGLDGKVIGMIPHSTAFAAMDQGEFKAYFDKAMGALSEAIGHDALAWMEG
jgi:hypothetical protein